MNKNYITIFGFVIGLMIIIVSAIPIVCPESLLKICEILGFESNAFLSYFGAVIGGVITLVGVILTILTTNNQMKQERVISAKPWIISRTKLLSSNRDLQEIKTDEFHYVTLNFDSEQNTIACIYVREKLPESLLNRKSNFNQDECLVCVVLKNIGGNSATHFTIMIDNFVVFPEAGLGVNDEIRFVFNLPLKPWDNEDSRYEMKMNFGDVVSENIYQQIEYFTIKKDGKGITFGQNQIDALSSPTLLKQGGRKWRSWI